LPAEPTVPIGPYVDAEIPIPIVVTFRDSNQNPIDLTGYTAQWIMRRHRATSAYPFDAVDGAAAVKTAVVAADQVGQKGQVTYTWVAGDLGLWGDYEAYMAVTAGGNTPILYSQRYAWHVAPSIVEPAGTPPADSSQMTTLQHLTTVQEASIGGRLTLSRDFVHSHRVATETELVAGLDASLAETVVVTLTANRVMGVPINGLDGHRMKVVLIEGGAGNFTLTPNASISIINWALNLAAGKSTELPLERISGVWTVASNPASALAAAVTAPAAGAVVSGGAIAAKVLDYGGFAYSALHPSTTIQGDGTNETTKINTFLASLPAGCCAAFPPAPVAYGTGAPVTPKSYTWMAGAGRATLWKDVTGNTTIISLNDVEGLMIQGMRFTGTGPWSVAGRGAIWAATGATYGTRKSKFLELWFDGVGTCGLVLANSTECEIWGIDGRNTLEHTIYLSVSTDITGGLITSVNAGVGSASANVNAIKMANCSRCNFTGGNLNGTKDEAVLFDAGTFDSSVVNMNIDGSGQRAVRFIAGSGRCLAAVSITNNNAASESVRVFGGTGHMVVCRIDAPNGANAVQVDAAAVDTLVQCFFTNIPAAWAIDNSGTRTTIAGNFFAATVVNAIVNRAAASGTKHMVNTNNATGVKVSDLAAGGDTVYLELDKIRMRDNNALLSVANGTGGTSGLVIDMANAQFALGIAGGGVSTTRLGAAGVVRMLMDATGIGFYNHATVAQPAAPVTLADVIAVIRGCGLSA
jgi:hypothetical protein